MTVAAVCGSAASVLVIHLLPCVYVVGPGSISGLMGWQRDAGHTQPWLPVGCGAGERVCACGVGMAVGAVCESPARV